MIHNLTALQFQDACTNPFGKRSDTKSLSVVAIDPEDFCVVWDLPKIYL